MYRNLLCLVFASLLVVASVNEALARDLSNPDTGRGWIDLSIQGAYSDSDELDDEAYLGVRGSYDINPYFAVGLETGYSEYSDSGGDITRVPLLFDVILKYPIEQTENRLVPYALAGVGVVFHSFDESSATKALGLNVEDSESLGYKFGAGADYYFSQNLALFVEGSYLFTEAEITGSVAGVTATIDEDLDTWAFGGGLKYSF